MWRKAPHVVATLYKIRAEMRAHKAGASSHQDSVPLDARLGFDLGGLPILL